jgi:glycosyltransferase involved in cell wall biosynthesis
MGIFVGEVRRVGAPGGSGFKGLPITDRGKSMAGWASIRSGVGMCLRWLRWRSGYRPSVSVIIPFFNDIGLLLLAARSVLEQRYPDIELLLVDDGSTEDVAPVHALAKNDPRVSILSKANGGTASARNYGLDRATGTYIAFLDSDDWWHSDKLERQIYETYVAAALISHTSYFAVFPARGLGPALHSSGAWVPKYPDIVLNCPVSMSTVVAHCSAFDFRRFMVAKRDTDVLFFVHCARDGLSFLGIDQPLSTTRYGSQSAPVNLRAQYEAIEILIEEYRREPQLSEYIPTLVDLASRLRRRHEETDSESDEDAIRQIFKARRLANPNVG